MRLTLRALSALLAYPSADLQAHIPEIREAIAAENVLPRPARRRLEPLLSSLENEDLLTLQAAYTELFDRSRALSLHLFEHVHGESRERGQAMIDLGQQYIDRGYLLESRELPDFVPVFVEFVSCVPPNEAREMLSEPAHVFAALGERLADRGSHYAAIFNGLMAVADARPDRTALQELHDNAPDDDPSKIDDEWEEAPVSFTEPGHEMGGPTGVVAKIRAAGRRVAGAAKG